MEAQATEKVLHIDTSEVDLVLGNKILSQLLLVAKEAGYTKVIEQGHTIGWIRHKISNTYAITEAIVKFSYHV